MRPSLSVRALWQRLLHPGLLGGIFLLIGLLVYAPVLHGELIWDDEYLVGQNPFFRSPVFIFEAFRHYLFFDSFSIYYRPVQNLSYIWDYWLFGGSAFGYHLTNILLHSASAWLLFLLLRRILPGMLARDSSEADETVPLLAALVAGIWLVHPIHNAAVAYISGRADSLASLFALIAWLLVLRACEISRRWLRGTLFLAAGCALLLAVCSKEIGLMWLLLFLLHLFFFRTVLTRRVRFQLLGGAIVVFFIYYFLHSLPGYRTPIQNGAAASMTTRILLMLRALGDYTGLIFFPSQLLMDRTLISPVAYQDASTWMKTLRYEYLSVLGLGAGLVAIALCWRPARGRSLRLFGASWFGLAFLPISNLFPLNAQVAEHWIYLASIGYLLFLAGCALLLKAHSRKLAAYAALVAIIGLAVRASIRASDWSDPETFFTRTIAAGGGTPRVFGNLAAVYARRGDYVKQEALLRRTLEQFPTFVTARINLGICLGKQGRTEEAEALLKLAPKAAEEVATQFPRTWSAALNLAGLRAQAGHTEEALAMVEEAQKRFPETWELTSYRADLARSIRGLADAERGLDSYASAHWWHKAAWLALAQIRADSGDLAGASAAFRHASTLDIHDPEPFAALARLEAGANRPEAAVQAQKAAIRRAPDQPSRYLLLAAFLDRLGRTEEAEQARKEAAELRDSVAPPAS